MLTVISVQYYRMEDLGIFFFSDFFLFLSISYFFTARGARILEMIQTKMHTLDPTTKRLEIVSVH